MTRRGTILFVVVLALAIAALVTTGMIQSASAARAAGRTGADRDQLRALAWSGVLAAASELGAQRADLLQGKDPSMTSRWQLFAAGGVKGTVRLEAFGARAAVSECGRLDVNGAAAADLSRVEGVAERADEIAGGAWTSVEELREVAGRASGGAVDVATEAGVRDVVGTSDSGSAGSLRWLSQVTVFSADAGVSERGAERIELGGAWDVQGAKAVAGEDGGVEGVIEALAAETQRPGSMSGLVGWLAARNVPLAKWGGVLDVFCDQAGVRTRVMDINRAEAAALAGLPGVDAALADRLVAARARLDATTLGSPAWPVVAGVLSPAQLGALLPRITTRSLVWRVRVVAEISPAEQEPELEASGLAGVRMVYDAVIDVTEATPRVAYLRDGTWEGVTLPEAGVAAEPEASGGSAIEPWAAPVLPPRVAQAGTEVRTEVGGAALGGAGEGKVVVGARVGRWTGGSPRAGR